jgi:nitrogen fixation protein FixH
MPQTLDSPPTSSWIPWYIVLFFIILACVFAGFTYIAKKTHSGIVTEQAYEKGLAYNEIIAKADAQKKQDLSHEILIEGRKITFSIKDRNGNDLAIKKATLWLYRPVRAQDDVIIPMQPLGASQTADLQKIKNGLWEARILATTENGAYQAVKKVVLK